MCQVRKPLAASYLAFVDQSTYLNLSLAELKYVVERWPMDYNHYRPHSSLGYQNPATYAQQCRDMGLTRPVKPVEETESRGIGCRNHIVQAAMWMIVIIIHSPAFHNVF